jgi:Ca2+/Na+ antiporter
MLGKMILWAMLVFSFCFGIVGLFFQVSTGNLFLFWLPFLASLVLFFIYRYEISKENKAGNNQKD